MIPEDVRRYAEDPGAWGPDLPPESGLTRILARWDDAVAPGTPALVTQAGTLSRQILKGLGFEPVAELEILVDPELP